MANTRPTSKRPHEPRTGFLAEAPARIPGDDGEQLDDLPADVGKIRAVLLDAFDRRHQVDLAASGTTPPTAYRRNAHGLGCGPPPDYPR